MKKVYLFGASALVIGAMMTSCVSHDFDTSRQDYWRSYYEKKFIEAFGSVSPDQDWGFGTAGNGTTRSGNTSGDYVGYPATHEYTDANGNVIAGANMNHNEWADPDKYYGGWLVPDALTPGQKLRVQKYFQANPDLSYQDPFYANFFVQQVYTGGTDAPTTGNHESTAAANGQVHAGSTLNQLTVGQACSHINDFNAGTCNTSSVLDNGQHVGGSSHNDQITLMVNVDDTSCFGYHETGGSNVKGVINHNDKMALVSAATIDAWAEANGSPGEPVVDKWNRSFMGFDYELLPEEDIIPENPTYAKITDVPNYNNIPYAWDGQKVMILGEAPESTETTKNDDFDLFPYFANHAYSNNGGTCTTENGKIVCNFPQYSAITFGQGNQDWSPYSKLVIEFEASPINGSVMNTPFSVGDTKVEVALNNEHWWGDNQGPTISTYDGSTGTLNITSVKLIGKTVEGVTVDPSNYYNPTYLLGDNDADKIMFYSSENTNQYGGIIISLTEDEMKTTQGDKVCLNLVKFKELKDGGYHPISTDLKKWVKWQKACDGYYSDWIVTLTEAKRITPDEPDDPVDPNEPEKLNIRILAEDISASDASDFDFNDVVFDVEASYPVGTTSVNEVKITLWAAGGTLPLRINSTNGVGGFEVHAALKTTVKTMTNTHAINRADNVNYFWADNQEVYVETISLSNSIRKDHFAEDVNNFIRVEVEKEEGQWVELTAQRGMVASKIGVPVGTPWALERHSVAKAFTSFQDWVNSATPDTWYKSKVDAQLYNDGDSYLFKQR